jgi:LPXTG-motif cell wall-anchored protein
MARPHRLAHPSSRLRSRGTRGLAGAVACAVLAGPVVLATPASAQTGDALQHAGATSAMALHLRVNLPAQLEPLVLDLRIDPVTGTIGSVPLTAMANAQALGSEAGVLKSILDGVEPLKARSTATLEDPGPKRFSLTPEDIRERTGGVLDLGLITTTALVTPDGPTSESTAEVASLGLALGAALAEAAAPLTEGVGAAADAVLTGIAEQAPALTGPVCDNVVNPVLVPVLAELGLDQATVAAICNLQANLEALNAALQEALRTLGDNLFRTGALRTSQKISPAEGGGTTATATASVGDLLLLGVPGVAEGTALASTATATAGGAPGQASANATGPVIADLRVGQAGAIADVIADLEGLSGTITRGPITAPLTTAIADLRAALNTLLEPLGASVVALDDSTSAQQLEACPTELTGLATGEYVALDGRCAAAATRGIGVELTLPTALTEPLGITGPFLTFAVVPSEAVAKAAPVAPVPAPRQLPRTGVDSPAVALSGLVLLGLVAGLARRRSLRA